MGSFLMSCHRSLPGGLYRPRFILSGWNVYPAHNSPSDITTLISLSHLL